MKILSLIVCMVFICQWSAFCQQKEDSIAALVNDKIITYGEVYRRVKEIWEKIDRSEAPDRQKEEQKELYFKKQLRDLVDESLIRQEAERYNIKISEERVQKLLDKEVEARGSVPDESELESLIRNYLTLQEIIKRESSNSPAEKRRAKIDTFVAPVEMRLFYIKNIKEYTKEKRVKVRVITLIITKHGNSREQMLARAESLVRELRKGADFAEIAKLYSNDGHAKHGGKYPVEKEDDPWNFIVREKSGLIKEVEDIAFSLEENEISNPIALDTFCQIVKVEGLEQGTSIPFNDVQEKIREQLGNKKLMEYLGRKIKKLRANSYIWPIDLFDNASESN